MFDTRLPEDSSMKWKIHYMDGNKEYKAGCEAMRLAAINAIEAQVRGLEGKLPKRADFTTKYAANALRAAERIIEVLPIPLREE